MEPKDEIKQKLDIVDTIGDYLPLKPAGSGNFKACCPFHQEKTPSFHVSREKDIWHCFGCDKGGDVFSFVMEIEGMSFPEVVRFLGKKVGVEVPEFRPQKGSNEKQFLLGLHEIAQKFYETILHEHADGEVARKYLEKRGISTELAQKFGLGYAPDKWDVLTSFLRKRSFIDSRIIQAGLAKKKKSGQGLIDQFRGRLLVPLADAHGNVVGFTGRILVEQDRAPKYLNTPETPIYHKSDVLYGLHLAKPAMRQEKAVIIVEGNLDVIASHKAGVEHVVASSGTALTESQLTQLKKLTDRIIFAFDADAAGFKAARRGIHLAQTMSFDVRVITIPEDAGEDPDDVVQKDPARWAELAQNPVHILEYYFRHGLKLYDVSNVDGKRSLAHFILNEIDRLQDQVEQEHWLQKLSDIVHVEMNVLRQMINRQKTRTSPKQVRPEKTQKRALTSKDEHAIAFLIGLMLHKNEYAEYISARLSDEHLSTERWKTLYKQLVLLYNQSKSSGITQNPFFATVQDHFSKPDQEENLTWLNASALSAQELIKTATSEQVRAEINRHIEVLTSAQAVVQRKKLEAAIRQAETSGDSERLRALIEQYTKLLEG